MGTAPSFDNDGPQFLLLQDSTNNETGNNTGQMNFHGEAGVIFNHNAINYNCARTWAGPGGGTSDDLFMNNTITRTCSISSYNQSPAGAFDIFGNRIVFLNNTFQVGAGNAPNTNANDGEQILCEYQGGSYQDCGSLSSSTSTTLTDATKSWPANGLEEGGTGEIALANATAVQIVSGPETGEWEYIASNTATTLTTVQPWPVPPAAGSQYEVEGWTATEWLVDGNTLTNNVRGIIFNGNSANNVIVNNTLTNDDGITLVCTQGALGYGAGGGGDNLTAPQVIEMQWDEQVYNNTLSDVVNPQQYIPITLSSRFDIENDNATVLGTGILGYECRHNSMTADIPNCGMDEILPDADVPGQHTFPAENYLNCTTQEFDPTPGSDFGWFVFPRPSVYDSQNCAVLGSIMQDNTSVNQTGTYDTQNWMGTPVTCTGSAYWLSAGVYDTTIADPIFENVGAPVYDTNGFNYNSVTAEGSAIDYQAEYGTLTGAAAVLTDTYASGGEYVGDFTAAGASVALAGLDGETGGTHTLTITYAANSASSLHMSVNGATPVLVSFPSTGALHGKTAWSTVTQSFALNANTLNTIAFARQTGDKNVSIDKITIS